jgi:hypothetical protein
MFLLSEVELIANYFFFFGIFLPDSRASFKAAAILCDFLWPLASISLTFVPIVFRLVPFFSGIFFSLFNVNFIVFVFYGSLAFAEFFLRIKSFSADIANMRVNRIQAFKVSRRPHFCYNAQGILVLVPRLSQ